MIGVKKFLSIVIKALIKYILDEIYFKSDCSVAGIAN